MPETLGSGLFIGFSTAPNDTAADGDGSNSPFTAAMIKHLPTPGLEINQVLTRVKADVRAATGNRQRPWTNSDLMADLYLVPQAPEPAVVATPPAVTPSKAEAEEEPIAAVDPAQVAGGQSLLLEASDNGRTGAVPFSGTIQWRRDVDEKGWATLVGEVVIPARNLKLNVIIRKNSDPSLPASHLMEITFDVGPDFIGGSIAGLPGVLLKNQELVQGVPLVGASARILTNSFLFALSASPEDVAANTNLLGARRFMDLALIYATGKRAIVTMEKGPGAVVLFNDVLAEWSAIPDDRETPDMVVGQSPANPDFDSDERVVTVTTASPLRDLLLRNGVGEAEADGMLGTLRMVLHSASLPVGTRLRLLEQRTGNSARGTVERLSIYFLDTSTGELKHAATAARTDRGSYVLGLAPPAIVLDDGISLGNKAEPPAITDANGKVDRQRALATN